MKLAFIGMSGAGKTFWATKFEKIGFVRYSIDDLIEQKLDTELKREGYKGIHDLAKWMGYPYERRYEKNSKRYLELEEESMRDVLFLIKNSRKNDDIIIDTTGSLIYLDSQIIKELKQNVYLVYLETPESVKKIMFELFIKEPKPVIWGESFVPFNEEESKDALSRCYPLLLNYRCKQYLKYAETVISYHQLHNAQFTTSELLMYLYAEQNVSVGY
ncbi:MAG: hypothetical protein WCO06_01750 [Candidatus Roizmanbacteria bacterium]